MFLSLIFIALMFYFYVQFIFFLFFRRFFSLFCPNGSLRFDLLMFFFCCCIEMLVARVIFFYFDIAKKFNEWKRKCCYFPFFWNGNSCCEKVYSIFLSFHSIFSFFFPFPFFPNSIFLSLWQPLSILHYFVA